MNEAPKPDDTKVFGPYWNGREEVYADPFVVHRKLTTALGGNVQRWHARYHDPDPAIHMPATEKLVVAIRHAFDMVTWDAKTGQGITELECVEVFERFSAWAGKKKAKLENLPIWQPPTAWQQPSEWQLPADAVCTLR